MRIYFYETEEQKQQIIVEQTAQGYVLTHVSNIQEGNFLGFMKDGTIPQPPTTTEQKIAELEQTIQDINLINLDINLTLYEEILSLREEIASLKNND